MADIETIAVPADGTPIATVKVIDKETGTETPVNVATCAQGVTCNSGKNLQDHLEELHAHANDEGAHLTAEEKAGLETQEGAQEKATTAKEFAIAAASLMTENAKAVAAADATGKANAARNAAYRYADDVRALSASHEVNTNNPHNVTAAQVGLGNVVNKAPNDLQPTYTASSALAALVSGEKLSVAFGKIAKAIADLIAHIGNKSNPHDVTMKQIYSKKTYEGTTNGNGNVSLGIDSEKYIILSVSLKDEEGSETYIHHLYKSTQYGLWFANITNITSKENVANTKFTFTIYYAAV